MRAKTLRWIVRCDYHLELSGDIQAWVDGFSTHGRLKDAKHTASTLLRGGHKNVHIIQRVRGADGVVRDISRDKI